MTKTIQGTLLSALIGATSLTTIGATSLTFTASPAHAVNCASPVQVAREHSNTRQAVRQEHETTRNAIIDAIEQQTVDLETKLDETTALLVRTLTRQAKENSSQIDKSIEAQKRIQDAAEMNETDRMRQQFRAEAESGEFDPNPFSCMLMDMFGSGSGEAPPAGGNAITKRTMDRLNGNDPAVQAGGIRVSQSVVDARDQYAGFDGSQNATTDFGLLLNEPTVDVDDSQRSEVASWIINNAVDPTPPRPVTEEDLQNPQGVDRAAEQQKRLARQSAATEVIAMSMNARAPVLTDSAGTFKSMAEDSAYNRPVPDRLSELQQLDIRTVYHYAPGPARINGDPGEQNGLNDMNEKGWLQEIHRIMSINTRINYLRLELENRDAIVNGLILATMNED